MENEDEKLIRSIKRATILSGIGMGLLLGIIMGLSVSEVVKVIFGVLTAILGAFLGFDKRSFAGMEAAEFKKEQQNSLFTALRAGWFGLAVVTGILGGIWIRTHEVFTMSVTKSVKQWTDAGYEPDYARKLVTYQRFAINPNTGELGQATEVQRAHQSNLFNSEQARDLCGATDPDQWNNDWSIARQRILDLDNESLDPIVTAIENNVAEGERFTFLRGVYKMICFMGREKTEFCKLGTDMQAWSLADATSGLAAEVAKLPADKQQNMMELLSALVCELEKNPDPE